MNIDNTHEVNYIKRLCYDPLSKLDSLRSFAIKNNIPIIGDEMFRFLRILVKIHNPKSVLEIGTAVGYSGSLILLNSEAELTTIELNPESHKKALNTFKENEVLSRVDLRLGDASEIIPELVCEKKSFDMVFIDGPKGKYHEHFKMIEPMLMPKSVIIFDNVLYQGLIAGRRSIRRNNTIRQRMSVLVEELLSGGDYDSSLVQIEGGVLIAVKR